MVSQKLVVTAKWGGEQRMMQILLFYEGMIPDEGDPTPTTWEGVSEIDEKANGPCEADGRGPCGAGKVWNWPIQESFYYPGANIAFMDAAAMSLPSVCGMNIPHFDTIGEEITYVIDLEEAFRCASDLNMFTTPMPQVTDVPIVGLHWAVEITGKDSGLWMSVHNMHMLPVTIGEPPCPEPQQPGPCHIEPVSGGQFAPPVAELPQPGMSVPAYLAQHTTVTDIRRSFGAGCRADPVCAKANSWTVPGASIPEHSGPGVAGTMKALVRSFKQHSNAGD